jgi:hypothetical protein
MEFEHEFDEDFKERLIKIIEASLNGTSLSTAEAAILFHWVKHINDQVYAWVPDKYKVDMPNYYGEKSNG